MRRPTILTSAAVILPLACAAVGAWLLYRATQEPFAVRVYERIELA